MVLRSSFGRHQDYTFQWVLGQSRILQAIVSLIRKAEEKVWSLQVGLGHELVIVKEESQWAHSSMSVFLLPLDLMPYQGGSSRVNGPFPGEAASNHTPIE